MYRASDSVLQHAAAAVAQDSATRTVACVYLLVLQVSVLARTCRRLCARVCACAVLRACVREIVCACVRARAPTWMGMQALRDQAYRRTHVKVVSFIVLVHALLGSHHGGH